MLLILFNCIYRKNKVLKGSVQQKYFHIHTSFHHDKQMASSGLWKMYQIADGTSDVWQMECHSDDMAHGKTMWAYEVSGISWGSDNVVPPGTRVWYKCNSLKQVLRH